MFCLLLFLGFLRTVLLFSIMDKQKVDPEIQEFLEVEQQKAQLQGQVLQSFVHSRVSITILLAELVATLSQSVSQ